MFVFFFIMVYIYYIYVITIDNVLDRYVQFNVIYVDSQQQYARPISKDSATGQ